MSGPSTSGSRDESHRNRDAPVRKRAAKRHGRRQSCFTVAGAGNTTLPHGRDSDQTTHPAESVTDQRFSLDQAIEFESFLGGSR